MNQNNIYLIRYYFDGLIGPIGRLFSAEHEMIEQGKDIALTGYDILNGFPDTPEELNEFDEYQSIDDIRDTQNLDLVKVFIQQVGEYLKVARLGTIDMFSYPSLFELIEDQNVEEWGSRGTLSKIEALERAHQNLFHQLNEEWNGE
ncbi:MAG: hypothetical protein ACQETE_01755 [Bacteroidota bacterium]